MNPYGNDMIVDQVIGSAYQVVRYVAANMETLIELSDSMDTVQSVLEGLQSVTDNMPALLEISGNIPELLELHSHLSELLVICNNLSMLSNIHDSLDDIQIIADNLDILSSNVALLNSNREALRRSYAEAGYHLVDGSFEAGGTLVNANDVLLQERTGKAFSGPAGTVAAGTNPASGGFVDKSGVATSASAISNANGGSVQDFIDSFALKIFQSPTDGGLTEIQTRTVNAGEVYEVRKVSDDSLATIYSDEEGTAEIIQNGTSNVSNSDGGVEFYIENGNYYIDVDGSKSVFRASYRLYGTVIADESRGVSASNSAEANGLAVNDLLTKYKEIVFPTNVPLEGVVVTGMRQKLVNWSSETSFKVESEGATGITFGRGAISCELHSVSIGLTNVNQTKYAIDGDVGNPSDSAPQYNRFYNIMTEGNGLDGSLSLLLNNTWSNSFYGCYFNRSVDGIHFGKVGSSSNSVNANDFYGCELRSINSYSNGGSPVIHRTGDGNSFIGGIIENWRKPIIVEGGYLSISKVYVEAFYSASVISLYSGKLLVDGCHRPNGVFIFGESTLIFKNNNCNTNSMNYVFPLIQRHGDIDAKIIVSGNDIPDGNVLIRPRQHKNLISGVWELSTKGTESIDDIQSRFSLHAVMDTPALTGDSSYGGVTYGTNTTQGIYYDDASETNPQTGVFTPKQSGIYSISASVNLSGVTAGQTVALKVAVSGRNRDYFLYRGTATASGNILVSGNCQCELLYGDSVNVQVFASGSSKDVGVLRGDATNGYTVFSAIRLK